METLFEELKRYVGFDSVDEEALRSLPDLLRPHFVLIADTFYRRILEHEEARKALEGGESQVGRLKVTLVVWMEKLFVGPWDQDYYELRARIGRKHVDIALPQHYMLGAMNVLRREFNTRLDEHLGTRPDRLERCRSALSKILDLELAIMLHTYREDLLHQQARVERLSTFGQLVGSIGHELRNPLAVIESSLFILKGSGELDERGRKHADRIGEQVKIANDIISQLLDMIRNRPLQRQRCNLAAVIAEAAAAVSCPEGVSLTLTDLSGLPPVDGDPVQLRQVFVNLLENATHAAAPSGAIRIQGRVEHGEVEVSVEDSGPGVDPAVRARLFEPLVTTKQKGIGLGLALVKRVLERHSGSIAYRPGDSGGARFVVRLPAAAVE